MVFISNIYKVKHLFKLIFSYLSFEIVRYTWSNYLFYFLFIIIFLGFSLLL